MYLAVCKHQIYIYSGFFRLNTATKTPSGNNNDVKSLSRRQVCTCGKREDQENLSVERTSDGVVCTNDGKYGALYRRLIKIP